MHFKRISKKYLFIKIAHSNLAHTHTHTYNCYIQAQKMALKEVNDKSNIIETFDREKPLQQLKLFESYRSDSFIDASRNLFGSKSYQFKDINNFILN